MSLLASALITTLFFFQTSDGDCKKLKKPEVVKTWMTVELAESFEVKRLEGIVTDTNGTPLDGVMIEVIKISKKKAKLVNICKTQKSGSYSFDKLKKGKYKLRFSIEGFDQTTINVNISPEADFSNRVRVALAVGN